MKIATVFYYYYYFLKASNTRPPTLGGWGLGVGGRGEPAIVAI